MTMDFSAQRLSYEKGALYEHQLPDNPKLLLQSWIKQAVDEKIVEPYAFSLATCGRDNQPSVRTLLMREITDLNNQSFGLIFYTNYDSAKSSDIAQNPQAQALFFWHALERQVRISGKIQKISQEKSINYFHKRPHDSQVAAWVSEPQSGVVANRMVMEEKFQQLQQQYSNKEIVPMPSFWGGYELVAEQVEFWQGRANRMHDRIVYSLVENNWLIERLYP